jgi:glucose/arabinose dehydrogenase
MRSFQDGDNSTYIQFLAKDHTKPVAASAPAAATSSVSFATPKPAKSGRKFSFRNLFPDLRTDTMIAAEKQRVADVLAKGQKEQADHQAVSRDSVDSRRSGYAFKLFV